MANRWRRAFVLFAVVLTIASFSVSCGRTLTITDLQGTPISGAYAIYHYEGSTFALGESISYQASPVAIVKSGANGLVAVPGIVRFHWPFIQGGPELAIDLIHAPTLHNGLAWVNRRVAISRPQEFEVSADLKTVRLADLSADPVRWEATLGNLRSLLDRLGLQQRRGAAAPPLTSELIERFKLEYAAMLDRYGETPRVAPVMPEAIRTAPDPEKREWQAMVDKDLAARPLWKDELERGFGTQVRLFSR